MNPLFTGLQLVFGGLQSTSCFLTTSYIKPLVDYDQPQNISRLFQQIVFSVVVAKGLENLSVALLPASIGSPSVATAVATYQTFMYLLSQKLKLPCNSSAKALYDRNPSSHDSSLDGEKETEQAGIQNNDFYKVFENNFYQLTFLAIGLSVARNFISNGIKAATINTVGGAVIGAIGGVAMATLSHFDFTIDRRLLTQKTE